MRKETVWQFLLRPAARFRPAQQALPPLRVVRKRRDRVLLEQLPQKLLDLFGDHLLEIDLVEIAPLLADIGRRYVRLNVPTDTTSRQG